MRCRVSAKNILLFTTYLQGIFTALHLGIQLHTRSTVLYEDIRDVSLWSAATLAWASLFTIVIQILIPLFISVASTFVTVPWLVHLQVQFIFSCLLAIECLYEISGGWIWTTLPVLFGRATLQVVPYAVLIQYAKAAIYIRRMARTFTMTYKAATKRSEKRDIQRHMPLR